MLRRLIKTVMIVGAICAPCFANEKMPAALDWTKTTSQTQASTSATTSMPATTSEKPSMAGRGSNLIRDLKPLNRACLPQAGRMLKDDRAACHCPPEKLCPTTLQEWNDAKGLPPHIATICCSRPKECSFEQIQTISCGQANGFTSTVETYCYKYDVLSSNSDGDAYKSAVKKVRAINEKIASLHGQISTLSQSLDTSGSVYNQAKGLIAQIKSEMAKVGAVMVTTDSNAPTSTSQVSERFRDSRQTMNYSDYINNYYSEEKARLQGNDSVSAPSNSLPLTYNQWNDQRNQTSQGTSSQSFTATHLEEEKKADPTLKTPCKDNPKPNFCIKTVSERCPPPPPDPILPPGDPPPNDCGGSADLTQLDRQFTGTGTPPACFCPTGTVFSVGAQENSPFAGQTICALDGDCVLKETKITMADGTLKNIEDIRVGEFVRGYMSINKVTAVTLNEELTPLHSINDKALVLTSGHPVLTRAGWKAIDPGMVVGEKSFKQELTKLEVGDEILMTDESVVKIESVTPYHQIDASKYNLSVGGDKTFTANGMVVRAYKNNTNTY